MDRKRRQLSVLIAHALLAAPWLAQAQESWRPIRPIRLIVPFPPGGGGDLMARLTAPGVSERLGQPVVVENKGGANGSIASDLVFKSPPDGHVVLLATADTASIYPHIAKVNFDATKFVPLAGVAEAPYVLAGKKDLPAIALDALQSLMKTRELSYATPGSGSTMHLLSLSLARQVGAPLLHVPFQGSGPATQALLAGTVDLCFLTVASAMKMKDRIRIYGLATKMRMDHIKGVPTLAEQGLPIAGVSWLGWVAPPGTPEPVAANLSKAVRETVSSPNVLNRLLEMGMSPILLSQSEFVRYYADEYRKWGEIIRAENLQAD